MNPERVAAILADQSGVISRGQVLAANGSDSDLARMVRRREWARVHPGVYVEHTGPLTWTQRAWAAVLLHQPAALAGASALVAHGIGDGDAHQQIELVVDRSRRVDDPPGVRTRQVADLSSVAQLHRSPPRVRIEHAAPTVASRARSDDAAVATLADVVQRRRTTAARLRDALVSRPRLARRALLAEVLADVAAGALSPMERRYLRDVERAHGLPGAERQERAATSGRAAYRDVRYVAARLVVELDGRLGHEAAVDRWADLERDLAALVDGDVTVRLGWRQVLAPCRTAAAVGSLLAVRGWAGQPRRCPRCSEPP